MKIIINRIRIKEKTTDGLLSIDGQHICETAEATPTLLPAGTYQITIFKCTKSKRQIPLIMLDADHYYQGKPTPHVCKKCTEVESQRTKIRMAEYYQIEKATQSGGSREEVIAYEQQVVAEAQAKLSKLITPHKGGVGGGPCPRLHFGNGVYNLTDGSIIVGRYLQPGIVLHSRNIFDRLYDRIEKAIARGTQVQLVIN